MLESELFGDESDPYIWLITAKELVEDFKVVKRTHALHMAARAVSRSRATNISMR